MVKNEISCIRLILFFNAVYYALSEERKQCKIAIDIIYYTMYSIWENLISIVQETIFADNLDDFLCERIKCLYTVL